VVSSLYRGGRLALLGTMGVAVYGRNILIAAFGVAALIGAIFCALPPPEPDTPTPLCNEANSGPGPDGDGWIPAVLPSGKGCFWDIEKDWDKCD
jgi:hypothetical protein